MDRDRLVGGQRPGVVVQMTTDIGRPPGSTPKASASAAGSAAAKRTSIAAERLSWYSISASASAEPHSRHQWTGLRPL
jgi:hypothetical protein